MNSSTADLGRNYPFHCHATFYFAKNSGDQGALQHCGYHEADIPTVEELSLASIVKLDQNDKSMKECNQFEKGIMCGRSCASQTLPFRSVEILTSFQSWNSALDRPPRILLPSEQSPHISRQQNVRPTRQCLRQLIFVVVLNTTSDRTSAPVASDIPQPIRRWRNSPQAILPQASRNTREASS